MSDKPAAPCLPSIGEPCGDCHRCRDTSGSETQHCNGCGEDYDPFEESHVGHVVDDGPTREEIHALANIIERQPALISTGSDQQDWFRSIEIAETILEAGYRNCHKEPK